MKFKHRSVGARGRYRKRRAVSDVVAVLLMVAIVVSLGVVVFTFASTGLSSLTQSFSGLMSGQANAVSEKFVVEQVVFTFSGTTGADVYVRNVGTLSSSLVSVYVVDQSTGAFVAQFTAGTLPATLNVGNFVDINLHQAAANFAPTHGQSYSFTVTSSLGNSVIYNAKAS